MPDPVDQQSTDYVIEPPAKQGASASSAGDDYQIEIPHDSQQQGPVNPYIYGTPTGPPVGFGEVGLRRDAVAGAGRLGVPQPAAHPAVTMNPPTRLQVLGLEYTPEEAAAARAKSAAQVAGAEPLPANYPKVDAGDPRATPQAAAYLADPMSAARTVGSNIAAPVEQIGSGLKDVLIPTDAEVRANGGNPNLGGALPGAPMTPQEQDAANKQMMVGLTKTIAGGGQVAMVLGAPEVGGIFKNALAGDLASKVALAKIAGSITGGAVASAGSGVVADKLNVSPEAKNLIQTAAFFVPSLLGGSLGIKEGMATDAAGNEGYSATTKGGKFGIGVKQTPEATEVRAGKLGTGSVGVTIPRGGAAAEGSAPRLPGGEDGSAPPSSAPPSRPAPPSAPEVQTNAQIAEVTRLAATAQQTQVQAEQLTGMRPPPPPKPKMPSPAGMDDGHLSQQTVETAGQVIQSLPPAARPSAVLEAVKNLGAWIMGKGTILGPDDQVVNVDSPKSAQAAATKIINAEMEKQKSQAEDAADEKQTNLETAQQERDEAITPTESKESTGNTPAVQIPKSPQVDRARAAIQGAPADATADHFDQIIRKTALVTTPVRKALVEEEVNRRANLQEDHAEAGMTGQPAAPGQSRTELQAWADGVKNGEHPFVHVPAKSDFVPAGVDGLTRTKVNGAGAFSGTYYHAPEVSAADIRKAARDKTDPQGALDAVVATWKGEKPVELDPEEISSPVVKGVESGTLSAPGQPGNSERKGGRGESPEPTGGGEGAPAVEKTTELPADLAKSKPRYGYRDKNFELDFEDPRDLAAYTLSQKTPNKAHDRFLDYYRDQFGTTAGLAPHGRRVQDAIKRLAKNANPEDGPLKVPWQVGTTPEEEAARVKLTPEAATGLQQIVEAAKADDPAATLDTILRHPADGKIITQALVNDGIITDSDTDVNPATSLLTTRARTKVGDALLSSVFSPEVVEAAPPFVREKLLGSMGSIGSIAETSPEWNLKPALEQAVAQYGKAFRGEETQDSGPVVDAIVKKLDGSPEEMRKAFSNYAVSASSPGENPNPVLDFNVAFGTELTPEQFAEGMKGAVSQPLAAETKPANSETTNPVAEPKPLAKGDQVTYRTNKGKERKGEVAWTDGKKVRITDNGSTVNKSVDDVKLASVVPAETAKAEVSGEATLVDHLQLAFQSGRGPKDYNQLHKLVEAFDGAKPTQLRMKEAQEAYEAMLNRVASEIVLKKEGGNREVFDRLTRLYQNQPNLSIRTSTSIDNQAYSTPLPLAFIADRFAGIDFKRTTVYEPTAGNGALLIAADPDKTLANEFNPARAATLKAEGFKVTTNDASTWSPAERVDAVVANPPFAKLPAPIKYDGYNIVKLDHLIAVKALSAMKDEGRAAIIIGAGDRTEPGEVTNAARPFFNYLYSHYNVVSDFELAGDLYARQGASFPVRVIAIDGRTRTAKVSPVAEDIQRLKTWEEVYAKASEHLGSNLEGRPQSDDELSSASQLRADTAAVPRPAGRPAEQGNPGRPSEVAGRDQGDGRDLGTAQPGIISHSSRVPTPPVGSPDITTRSDGDVAFSDRLAEGQSAPRTVRREPTELDGRAANDAVAANALADESNQFQVTYRPRSEKKDVAVMAPKALIGPMHSAMDVIAKDVGDLDEFVANELGYPSLDEMHSAFMGVQTDAVAAAIYQLKRGKALIISDQCVAGETRIYDPLSGLHTPIKQLAEKGEAICVLALTPEGMKAVPASSPFRKGIADLYRVALADGRSITVTKNHRFLTPDGWKTIAQGLSVGHSVATSLSPEGQRIENSAATRKEGVLRYSQTASGSTDHCSPCSSPDGELPRQDQDSAQAFSPSRGDARGHSPASSRGGGLVPSAGHSDPDPLSDLRSRRSSSPAEILDPSSTSDRAVAWYERLLALKRRNALLSLRFPSSPLEVSSEVPSRLGASFCGLRPLAEFSHQLAVNSREQSVDAFQPSVRSLQIGLPTHRASASDSSSQELSYVDHTGWQVVESIEFVRNDEFFDMWVPYHENYAAEGFVNHNTGLGKGRMAAAMIRWAELHGHLPIFVTEKPTLFSDMYGDLTDIGSGNTISPLLLNTDASITNRTTGEKIFRNPGSMKPVMDRIRETGSLPPGRNALFLSYSQINTDNRQQLTLHELAPNAVFVLDESHNAGGQSATGAFISEVIGKSKGVVFLSATWAKRPDNLPVYAGMTDIATAIPDRDKVADAIAAGGAPLQAVVTSQLAQAGQFVRRERSFDGIEIRNVTDSDNKAKHEKISDKVTEVLRAIMQADSAYHNLDFERILADAKKAGKSANSAKVQVSHMEFSSIVHNMVKQLLLALKADTSADMMIASIEKGERPIYALENTMGSFLGNYVDGHNLSEGDSLRDLTYSKISDRALMRTRYYNETDEMGNKTRIEVPLEKLSAPVRALYDEAQALIDNLNVDLPVSPLDHIRDRIEKAGYKVAEITGRDLRIDYSGDTPKLGMVPDIERKDRVNTATQFNNGSIDALVINKAAAAGISLHASEKFLDQRPRHMIVGQPAGDVNVVMQMLGRINRTGQVQLPSYSLLSAALPAEMRPAIVLAKKMKSLNANVSSNTRSATSVKAVDMFNKYGDKIVAGYLVDNPEMARVLGLEADTDAKGEPSANEGIAMKATGHSALLTVKEQQQFMDAITEAYTNYIDFLDETGQNDLEPVTYDYDARETHKERMYQGTDPSSPFGQDAHYGEYNIKRQGKPFTPEEVNAKLAETYGPELMQKPPHVRDTEFARSLAAHFEELYKPYYDGLTTANAMEKATAMRGYGRSLLNEYRVGSAFSVEINGDVAHAVVTNIEGSKKTSGNPYAPSSLQFTLAINSPLRSIKVPGSQMGKITTANLGRNADIAHLFKDVFGDSRQKAKIITGNLLGAYGELKAGVKGRIISFTMNDGTTQLGIQMPSKFDIEKDVSETYAMRSPEAAFELLRGGDRSLQSSGQEIGVFGPGHRGGDDWTIRTKVSKAVSGKFFLDPRLRELVVGGDFVSSGGVMKATIKDGMELDALEVIMGKIALYAPSGDIKAARQLDEKVQAGGSSKPSNLRKAMGSGEEGFVELGALIPPSIQKIAEKVGNYLRKAVPATWGELSKATGVAVKTPKAIGYEIASVLYPAMLADADARDIMGRALGEPALELFKARLFLDGIDKMFEGMPEKDWVEFVDRIQHEQDQPTFDLQKAAEMLKSVMEGQRMAEQAAVNLGRKKSDRIELQDRAGYFPNRYSTPPGGAPKTTDEQQMARIFAKRPFAGPKTFTKQQKYTLKDAVADGGVPLGNPVRMVLRRLQEGAKFVAAQHALWNGRQTGLIVYKSARGKMPPNFVKMQDNIARVFRPVETAEGGTVFVQGGEWVIEKDAGRLLNNYLSSDPFRNSTIGGGFVKLVTSSMALKMAGSPFHYGMMAFWGVTEGVHAGIDELYNHALRGTNPAHLLGGAKKLAMALVNPIAKTVDGNRIVKMLKDQGDFIDTPAGQRMLRDYPDLPELLRLVFAGGFRMGTNEDIPDSTPMSIRKDAAAGRWLSVGQKTVPFLARIVSYPLFNFIIPRMKLMANIEKLSMELDRHSAAIADGSITPETVARNVVAVNENSFGEFNYQNNYWNNSVKTAMQLLLFAPGWKEGTWRGAAQAAKEVFTQGYTDKFYEKVDAEGKAKGWRKYPAKLPALGQNTGRMMSALIVAALIAAAIAEYLHHLYGKTTLSESIQQDVKENGLNWLQAADLEVLHPRSSKVDRYGHPIRFNLPTDLRDFEHGFTHPIDYAGNSLAPWLIGVINTLRNRDFKNDYVYDPAGHEKLKEAIYYNLEQDAEPIGMSNYLKKGGPQDTESKIEQSVGLIGGAPKGWDDTRSVARALELKEAHNPRGPLTPAAQHEKEMLVAAPPTKGQARYALRTRNLTELDKIVMNLSYTDAKDVYDHATPDEQKTLLPIMRKKQAAAVKKARER